jgi:hypothetical protein
MFSHLKEGLTAAMKTSHEYIFSTHLCHAFFTDISIGNHAMASIQLGINSTSDVWKFCQNWIILNINVNIIFSR